MAKPTRRRRMRRTQVAPAGVPVSRAPVAAAPPTPAPEMEPRPVSRKSEPSVTRFSSRDYSYVRRELQRILLLATLIIVLIVVLSFFLP